MVKVLGSRTLIQGDGTLEKIPDGRMDWWFKQGRLRAQKVLEDSRLMFDAVADALVRFETLSEQQFAEIAKNHLHDSCPPEASSVIA